MQLLKQPIRIERHSIPVRDLPRSLDGLRIVQLSDFHYDGKGLSTELLLNAIKVSNSLNPDLIVLTGDYVTDAPEDIYQLVPYLQLLNSPYGIHAILGNHDNIYSHSRSTITAALQSVEINVLWDQVSYLWGGALAVVGLSDYWWKHFNPQPVMDLIPGSTPRIVLSHNPDSAKPLSQFRVDLQLSGHTHGGQVVLPGLGPIVKGMRTIRKRSSKPIRRQWSRLTKNCDKIVQYWEWSEGLHAVGDNTLYVNRGLGTHWPGRLFCPPEVSLLTLESL
jgi:uncharacterized protein